MTDHLDPSHDRLIRRVRRGLDGQRQDEARLSTLRSEVVAASSAGGTTLRSTPPRRRWLTVAVLGAAAMLVLALLVPSIDRQTTVSAAEILGRSRAALAAPADGVERLFYDLALGGVLENLLPSEQAGALRVEELIDHEHPGRYRLLKIAADGSIVGGIADDPLRGTRVRYIRANGRGYLLRFTGATAEAFSFPAVKRMALDAFITLMQAEATQPVRELSCSGEPCYDIAIDEQPDRDAGQAIVLTRARALVAAADARLIAFSASGYLAGRRFSIDFTLTRREVLAASAVTDADFDVPARSGDLILSGTASSSPVWDILERALSAIPQPAVR